MISPAQRKLLRAASRRTIAAGRMVMPGRFARRTHPEWPLHRVKMIQDGRTVDHVEAAVTFADAWWAPQAVYIGCGRGWHCYERPSDEEKP